MRSCSAIRRTTSRRRRKPAFGSSGWNAADGAAVLEGWRSYYAEQPALVAPAGGILTRVLPLWTDDSLPAAARVSIGLALADSRMFAAAGAVLQDPCAAVPLPADAGTRHEQEARRRRRRQLGVGLGRGRLSVTTDPRIGLDLLV